MHVHHHIISTSKKRWSVSHYFLRASLNQREESTLFDFLWSIIPQISIHPYSPSFKLLFLVSSFLQAFLTVSSTPFTSQLILFRHAHLFKLVLYRRWCVESTAARSAIRRSGDSQTLVYNRTWWLGLLCQIPFFGTSAGSFGTFEQPPGALQVTAKDKSDEAPAGQVVPHNCVEPLPSIWPGISGVISHVSGGMETTAAVKVWTGVGGESHREATATIAP